jgi:Carboxypeptidase regulatory-like domain
VLHSIVFILVLAAGQVPDESRPPIVSGRVVDAGTGRPVPGAVVTPAGSAAVEPVRPVLTNAAGQFVVRGLRTGSLVLTATRGGYADATYGQRRPGGSTQPIPVADGQRIKDLEIRMWKHGVITGTVIDEAGDPVVGVRVQAFERGFVAGRKRYSASRSGTTDDRGVYRIARLMPGEYVVAVPNRQTAIPTEVMDVFFSGGSSEAARSELARELSRLDAAIVPAGSQYAMNVGTVTVPLLPGTATPTSRANGALMIYPTLFYPSAPSVAQAAPLTVRSGEERSAVDVQLQPSRSLRVSGQLLAPEGMASHVGIRLLPAGGDGAVDDLDVETAVAMSDSTGAFTFAAVPPGQYVLSVVRVPRPPPDLENSNRIIVNTGSVSLSTSAPAPPGPPAPIPVDATLWARIPLAVGDEDLANVVVPLRAGPRMSGRVEFDGTAQKPDGPAIANLRITLDPADGSRADGALAFQTGHPDESGQFTTFGVPAGRYVVNVAGISFPGWVFKEAQYQGRDLSDVPIDMQSADVSGVVLTFTDRPATLGGVVRNAASVDGAAVVLAYPVDSGAWSSSGARPRRMRTARADKDGVYSLRNLAGGEYYVVAVSEDSLDDWRDPALLKALTRLAQQVRLVDGEQKSQDLMTVTIR